MDKEIVEFYESNAKQLEQAWLEYLDYMQDSAEHINYMRNSETCFWEFVQEQMEAV